MFIIVGAIIDRPKTTVNQKTGVAVRGEHELLGRQPLPNLLSLICFYPYNTTPE